MSSLADPFAALWRELIAEGLITATPDPLGGGNLDRAGSSPRTSWRARTPTGAPLKLTVAADLTDYRDRTFAFHGQLPRFTPEVKFHRSIEAHDVVAETFFEGRSLDALLSAGEFSSAHGHALAELSSALTALAIPSTDAARLDEWIAWTEQLLALSCWDPAGRTFLRDTTLPALHDALQATPPSRRWIHGDLAGRNILFAPSGAAFLIDSEYATATHFAEADLARFHLLTPGIDRVAPLIAEAFPAPSGSAQLLFWLQQVQRELAANTSTYVQRWLPSRLAHIHRLTEALTQTALVNPWSAAATPPQSADRSSVDFHLEHARWLIDSPTHALNIAGWCASTADALTLVEIQARIGSRVIASSPLTARPDVQAHFNGDLRALHSGFELSLPPISPTDRIELIARTSSNAAHPFWSVIPGDLPGRGPVLCFYSNWAAVADPDPSPPSVSSSATTPRFSILLPVYNPPADFLRACIESVRAQHHTAWELRIVDDASTSPEIPPLLQHYRALDPRIHVLSEPKNNGISRATNAAFAAATGDYVVMLDHDDVLRPHALSELAAKLTAEPDLDAVYSDEDKFSPDGTRTLPLLKPGFSPEFLRGVMYVGHVLCVRTSLARALGGFDPTFDGIQDYEFILRLSERTSRVGHIPRILYHWRQSPQSSALLGNVKGNMDNRQARAVQAHLQRLGDPRRAEPLGGHRIQLVARADFAPAIHEVRLNTPDAPLPALLSAANASSAKFILLLDPRTPALSADARRELAAVAALPDSGCVAPILVSSANHILESGCTYSESGDVVPIMRGFDASGDGYNGTLRCNREVAAVSPWCVLIRRSIVLAHLADGIPTWFDFLETLRCAQLFHRVCASVRVTLPFTWREFPPSPTKVPPAPSRDPFYNPHFLRVAADYQLSPHPPHLSSAASAILANLETTPASLLPDGSLDLRGWAFHIDGLAVRIEINAGDLHWTALCPEPRPDVATNFPFFSPARCGFSTRLRLSTGRHLLSIVAVSSTGDRHTLLERPLRVPATALLRRAFRGSAHSLLTTQLLAGPSHAPRLLRPETFPTSSSRTLPRLAIVTPSFQHAPFIEETLRSVLTQSITCDYVVQDGASTDGSVDLINRHADRLHAIASEPDSGQADAIRRAFAKTSGAPDDLMAWINSDDFYLPGTLAYVVHYFATHPEVDVLYGHRIVVDENSREIGRWFLPPHDPEILRLNDFVPQETLFWRRRVWNRVGGIDPSFQFALDWDLLLRFQAAGANIVRVPYFLACFRVHSAQKTSAQISSIGQQEIDALRARTFGRSIPPDEIETHPCLLRYLRHSARIELLWRTLGIRSR